ARQIKADRKALLDARHLAGAGGAKESDVAAASLFTTESVDAISRQIRAQLGGGVASFRLGTAGERTVFPAASLTAIQWRRQTGTATFSTSLLPTPALSIFPGSVGTIAFGAYDSPNYQTAAGVTPPTPT